MHFIIAFHLVQFAGPNDSQVEINPMQVVSVRPIGDDHHYGKGARCLIHTTDGKFVAVIDDCDTVWEKLEKGENGD